MDYYNKKDYYDYILESFSKFKKKLNSESKEDKYEYESFFLLNKDFIDFPKKRGNLNNLLFKEKTVIDPDKFFFILDEVTWSKIKLEYSLELEIKVKCYFKNKKCYFQLNKTIYYFYFINKNKVDNSIEEGYFEIEDEQIKNEVLNIFLNCEINSFFNKMKIKSINEKQKIEYNNICFNIKIKKHKEKNNKSSNIVNNKIFGTKKNILIMGNNFNKSKNNYFKSKEKQIEIKSIQNHILFRNNKRSFLRENNDIEENNNYNIKTNNELLDHDHCIKVTNFHINNIQTLSMRKSVTKEKNNDMRKFGIKKENTINISNINENNFINKKSRKKNKFDTTKKNSIDNKIININGIKLFINTERNNPNINKKLDNKKKFIKLNNKNNQSSPYLLGYPQLTKNNINTDIILVLKIL